jgi:hypothetical protein
MQTVASADHTYMYFHFQFIKLWRWGQWLAGEWPDGISEESEWSLNYAWHLLETVEEIRHEKVGRLRLYTHTDIVVAVLKNLYFVFNPFRVGEGQQVSSVCAYQYWPSCWYLDIILYHRGIADLNTCNMYYVKLSQHKPFEAEARLNNI